MTDPPMVGDVALAVARRFRVPLVVVSQDVFPEIAVELGRLTNPVLVRLLDVLIRLYLRRADTRRCDRRDDEAAARAKGVRSERVRVIPNWVDTTAIVPEPRDNPWARANGLGDRFVVMHSGNIGHAQDLDTLIRASDAARRPLDSSRSRWSVSGHGTPTTSRMAEQLGADRVTFLGYQPRELLPQSLSSADIHFVGLARGLGGYVVPSRLYGILAWLGP